MATSFTLEHDFPDISVELFEKHLNHPDLIESLKKMPAFRSRDLVEKKDLGGGVINWRFKVVAGGNVPGPVQKVLPEEMLTWHEDTKFVPAEHTIYWTITPLTKKAAEMLESKGIWKLIPKGKGTKRIIEGSVNVKVPFVGKIAEAFLVGELKRNYDVEPDLQKAFYKKMT
jgi:hypothetical protein